MAATCFSSPPVLAHKSCPLIVKPVCKIVMLKDSPIAPKKPPTLQVKSSLEKNKVFENLSEGVLCYIDDNGEIVCEGYDEGPRFHQHLSRTSCNPRDAEIIDMLHRRLLRIANGAESNYPGNGAIGMQEDFTLEWF